MNKPRGRRPGAPDTRERILEAARTVFLEKGYPGATMRAVAASADVDVALVSYYFGSKQGLFAAAMTLAVSPATVLEQALTGPPEHLQERIIAAVITTWDDPRLGAPMRMLVAAALQDPALLRVVREYVEREIIARLAERLGGADATVRVTAFVATVAGVIFARHLLGLAPLVDMPPDELTRRLTATRPRPARPT
jgi:AcrR family transcriptional regulator